MPFLAHIYTPNPWHISLGQGFDQGKGLRRSEGVRIQLPKVQAQHPAWTPGWEPPPSPAADLTPVPALVWQHLQPDWGVESGYPNFPKSDSCNLVDLSLCWLHPSMDLHQQWPLMWFCFVSYRNVQVLMPGASVGQCPACCPSSGMSFHRIMVPSPWQEGWD